MFFMLQLKCFMFFKDKDAVRERNVLKNRGQGQRKGRVPFYSAPRARGPAGFRHAEPASDALARWTSGARIIIGLTSLV
jgi:hypothetical protein